MSQAHPRDRLPTVVEYNELRASVGLATVPDQQAEAALKRSLVSCCVEDAGTVVGMARAVGDVLYVQVVDVLVHPQHQGRGIGTALVARVLEDLRAGNPPLIGLSAAPAAVGVYRRAGFVPDPDPYLTIRPEWAKPARGARAGS